MVAYIHHTHIFIDIKHLYEGNYWSVVSLLYCMDIVPRTHIDDEYANASERDPKILLTTSRNPSAPLSQFTKVIQSPFLSLWLDQLINYEFPFSFYRLSLILTLSSTLPRNWSLSFLMHREWIVVVRFVDWLYSVSYDGDAQLDKEKSRENKGGEDLDTVWAWNS